MTAPFFSNTKTPASGAAPSASSAGASPWRAARTSSIRHASFSFGLDTHFSLKRTGKGVACFYKAPLFQKFLAFQVDAGAGRLHGNTARCLELRGKRDQHGAAHIAAARILPHIKLMDDAHRRAFRKRETHFGVGKAHRLRSLKGQHDAPPSLLQRLGQRLRERLSGQLAARRRTHQSIKFFRVGRGKAAQDHKRRPPFSVRSRGAAAPPCPLCRRAGRSWKKPRPPPQGRARRSRTGPRQHSPAGSRSRGQNASIWPVKP